MKAKYRRHRKGLNCVPSVFIHLSSNPQYLGRRLYNRGDYIKTKLFKWTLIQSDGCPRKTRVFRPKRDTGGIRAQGKTGRTQREGSHVRPRREDCGEATPADSLISDSSPRDCKKVNCCCLIHQSVLFIIAALATEYRHYMK